MDLFSWAEQADTNIDAEAPISLSMCVDPVPAPRRKRRVAQRQVAYDAWTTLPLEQQPARLRGSVTTAADALAGLDTLAGLTDSQRAAIRTAIGHVAKASQRSPAEIGLAPAEMVPLLRPVLPASLRIKRKSWANARAALRTLAKRVGHHVPDAVLYAPVSARWEALLQQVVPLAKAAALRGFVRHLERLDVGPEDASAEHLRDYRIWLETFTYELRADVVEGIVRTSWNRAARTVAGWPPQRIEPPGDPRRVRLDDSQLPATLRAEIAAYKASRLSDDLDDAVARSLSAGTAMDRRNRLLFAASVLVRTGTPSDQLDGLRELLTVENLKKVLRWMRARSKVETFTMNEVHVAIAFVDAARTFLRLSEVELQPLVAIRQRIRPPKAGLSQRARTRLQPFDSERLRDRLCEVPARQFAIAERLRKGEHRPGDTGRAHARPVLAAQHFERGLAVRLLLEVPLRRRTLSLIDVRQHLRCDERGRIQRLCIPGAMTKNGVAIDALLTPELAARLDEYIRLHRPQLRGAAGCDWLFPGPGGNPRSETTLAKRVSSAVEEHVGTDFNLSLFRHLAATILFESNPNAGPIAQRLLAHTQLKTTERLYGEMSTRSAHATWTQMLEKRLARASNATRSTKPTNTRRKRS